MKEFFASNPMRKPDVDQMQNGQPWIAFPGEHSAEITRVIRDNVSRIVQQTATPEEVQADLASQVRALLPQ